MKNKLLVLALITLLFTGCLGGSPGSGTAEVGLYVTDSGNSVGTMGFETASLDDEIAEVWITVKSVTARVNNKWVKLFDVPESESKINLRDLHFKQKLLGNSRIPAGKYTEIRFELADGENNYIVFKNGQKAALKVPSNELKPEINITIAKDTVVELVFDVNQDFFIERGNEGSYNVNPRKSLKFVGSFDDIYGSIEGEIVLPEKVEKLIAIDIKLFRTGNPNPIWLTSLQDSKLKFEINTLPEGEYWLEAEVSFFDLATLELRTDPFQIKAGKLKEISLR